MFVLSGLEDLTTATLDTNKLANKLNAHTAICPNPTVLILTELLLN
jgi:hypothetical protein